MAYYGTLAGQAFGFYSGGYNIGTAEGGYQGASQVGNSVGVGLNATDFIVGGLAVAGGLAEAYETTGKFLGTAGGVVAAVTDLGGVGYGLYTGNYSQAYDSGFSLGFGIEYDGRGSRQFRRQQSEGERQSAA